MEKALAQLGLNKNEIKVYLALLEMGTALAGEIAIKTIIHRANVYDALETLLEKGLISYIIKDNKKHFHALPPKKLIEFLKLKEMELKRIIPQLEKIKKPEEKSLEEVFISRGTLALKLAMNELLELKSPLRSYGMSKKETDTLGPFLDNFHKRRIEQKINAKIIYHEKSNNVGKIRRLKFTSIKYVPLEHLPMVSTTICGNEVLIVLWSAKPLVIKIINKSIAEAYRDYFELLWKNSKSN